MLFALSEGAGTEPVHRAPTLDRDFAPAGQTFEKASLHPAETSVTVCDDRDGIFDTAPAHRNIVTPSHIVTIALSLQALQCARSECGCFHIGCRTHSAAVRR